MWRNGLFLLFSVPALAQLGALTVSNVRADAISHSSLRLTWDNSSNINAIRVRYGFSGSYEFGPGGGIYTPGTSLFSQFGQTASLSGLQPDGDYHFCPQSSADGGKTWSGCVDLPVKLLPSPTHPVPPRSPASFDISYPTQSGARLMASPDCSNLQDLLNQARYGDTVLIPAGTTCSDSYQLPRAPDSIQFPADDVDGFSDQVTLRNHPFADGQKVHLDSDGCLPASVGENIFCSMRGMGAGTDYVVERVDNDHIRFRNVDGTPVTFAVSTFTVDAAAGTFSLPPNGPLLYNGAVIQVRSTGVLPGGLQPRKKYYVLNPSLSRVVRLALVPGGAPIPITDEGQGTHSFTDPGKGTDAIMAWPPPDAWIVVRTATPDEEFCPEGVRCLGEIWAPKMARIAQMTPPTGSSQDLRIRFGFLTHNWRFVGIEFTHADNSATSATTTDPIAYYGFISTRRAAANIILDRCYLHGLGAPNRIYRAIETFDGTNMALINSDLEKLDFWHPSVSYRQALLPTITGPRTVQIAPGDFHMGMKDANLSSPLTLTISGTGSGTAIVYFDLNGVLGIDLPLGVQGTCSQPCAIRTTSTASPAYPSNSAGRIAAAQITDLLIANGMFTATAYRAPNPKSSQAEGAQSIIAGNGPGPFLIQNNTISSTGIPLHFDDSGGAAMSRSDFVVRRNLFTAPLSQQGSGPLSDGFHYFHRNMLEWKGGERILVEGNVFENNFADVSPLGAPLVITPRSGGYVSDVMIRSNTFRNNAGGIAIGAIDSYNPISKPIERVAIVNNLFHHNDGYALVTQTSSAAATGILLYAGYAMADLQFDHNTVYDNRGYDPVFLHLVQNQIEGVSITNNFLWVNDDSNRKGIDGESYKGCPSSGPPLLDCALQSGGRTSYTFARNTLMPGWTPSNFAVNPNQRKLVTSSVLRDAYSGLPDNWVVDGASIEDRLSQAGVGAAEENYRITGDSPYSASGSRGASDGKAIGADMDQLEAAQGLIGPASVALDGTSAAITVRVPDEGAACYVLYGQGNDVSTFARTRADTSTGRTRTMRIESIAPETTYNYTVLCSGAANSSSGSFSTAAASSLRQRRE